MAEYYLISQLPSLDGVSENMPLPITEERFFELCERFLSKKALCELNKLTLTPPKIPEASGSALINAWNDGERELRLALEKARAEKMKKPFDIKTGSLSVELIKISNIAVEIEDPMEAEMFLFEYRLKFLESIRPMDSFSEDYVFYFGLRLMLMQRIRRFDAGLGETAYKNIYSSILNGDRLEAI